MKPILIPALAAATLLASFANAQTETVVDLTGSTAGRSATHAAILQTLSSPTYAYQGSSASGATRAIYRGSIGANSYIIRTFWSGSVNGVRDIAQQIQQTGFIDKNVAGSASGQQIEAPALAPASPETAPEIGFSDVFQSTTAFTSPALVVEDEVGIIPFKWFKNKGASAGLINMTPMLTRGIYGSLGTLPLSQFTGVAADAAKTVYAAGRNSDSGTRITAMAESGYGVFLDVTQYQFTAQGGAITASSYTGNTGYGSGSNISAILGNTWTEGDIVAYLGSSDWGSAVAAGAVELTWNGVPYSDNAAREGSYTFWGYLHMNRMALAGAALTFYNQLKTNLTANPGSVLIKETDMKVSRDGDGAPVFAK